MSENFEETLADYSINLICGGIPCQPFSVAGQRKGMDDDRWLWPEFFRIIRLLRPRWVLIENVPNLRHLGLSAILRDLASLGYDAEWATLPTGLSGGHLRKRLFIVAYNMREGLPLREEPTNRQTGFFTQERFTGLFIPCDPARRDWETQPLLGRGVHGIPHRVDRIRGLGNAVVPQVAELIGKQMMKHEGVPHAR